MVRITLDKMLISTQNRRPPRDIRTGGSPRPAKDREEQPGTRDRVNQVLQDIDVRQAKQ